MQLTDKLEKGYTGTLVFLDKEGKYFSSMVFANVKTEAKLYEVLKAIHNIKTNTTTLDNLPEKEVIKFFKGYKIITKKQYERKLNNM